MMGRGAGPRLVGMIVFSLSIYSAIFVSAQERGRWQVMSRGGVEEVSSRDEFGSPLLYQGVGFPLILSLGYSGDLWAVSFEGGGFYTGVNGRPLKSAQASSEGHWASGVAVDLALQIDRAVIVRDRSRVRLGGRINHWTLYRSYRYGPTQIGAVETWDGPVTLDLVVGLERDLSQRFELRLFGAVALGGWVIRPHYSIRGDERMDIIKNRLLVVTEGDLATVNRLQMVTGHGELRWRLSAHLTMVGQYRVSFFDFQGAMRTRAFRQGVTVGLSLSF